MLKESSNGSKEHIVESLALWVTSAGVGVVGSKGQLVGSALGFGGITVLFVCSGLLMPGVDMSFMCLGKSSSVVLRSPCY